MITKEPERLQCGPDDKPRVYWIKKPVLHDRAQWRRATAACGGKFNGTPALLDLMSDGVRRLMDGQPPEIVDALLVKIERQRERFEAWRESSPDDVDAAKELQEGLRDLGAIESEVLANFAPYAAAVGDDASYWQIAGIEAARLFLVKWEGFAFDLTRTRAGVGDECLNEIPENDFAIIGMFADRLSRVRDSEKKTSNSRPVSSSDAATSINSNGATSGPFPNSESNRPDQSAN